ISLATLLDMSRQIASGMKYLESCGLVHGDLSARNLVKITDLSKCMSVYKGDYYCSSPTSTPMPVRWMAPEALLLEEFSNKSDVWSYAVTLWQLMTLARYKPYHQLDDCQVIENSLKQRPIKSLTGSCIYLHQPIKCPLEVYDLMMTCWKAEPKSRPTFADIYNFFSIKTGLRENDDYRESVKTAHDNDDDDASGDYDNICKYLNGNIV
ncbi:hypothetical protein HELRODRAFT_79863, partial [Helobdella robusta]|uniref:Protein kinase domain-containing protein n=1 Tax=Helobdella robusta TaxID=6412 RepID=T1G3U5_HELRO